MSSDKGNRLKVARKAAGLGQKQLGERLGYDQAFISRVENGSNEGTVAFWCDAAGALGVTLDSLLAEASEPAERVVAEPLRLNRVAILADYTAPPGLRDLAADTVLCDTLAILDEEWTQLAGVPLLEQASKDGFLQLLITLRNIRQ